MKIEWLRKLAVASNYRELTATFEELAGSGAQFFDYDFQGWCLRRQQEQLPLDNASLAGQCALDGDVCRRDGHMALPVRRFGSLAGVLVVSEGPLEDLEALAEVFALVMEPLLELDRVRQSLSGFQQLSATAVESLPDCHTGHIGSVCQLTAELAEYLDISQQARQRLWTAAQFHDLGKLILHGRPPAEIEHRHPEAGADFLDQTGASSELVALVRSHHQSYDEAGELTIEQCILILAEAFEEFMVLNQHVDFQRKVSIFFQEKVRFHHPDVLDALAGLLDSGRLDRLR